MAGGLRFLWRPPQGAPRPGPGQYVALSWAHTSFIRCPFRRGMLWAGLPDPDPVAFLSEELARGSSDTPATGILQGPLASSHPFRSRPRVLGE